ncbi:DUF1343 domain-containing protein [candidate division KSB1 bacterium]|nr:DUF1343 domain-containing protein [candidate division KSB1 bacterium]
MIWPSRKVLFFTVFIVIDLFCRLSQADVLTGLDVLSKEGLSRLKGLKVGLVVHPASVRGDGVHAVDVFCQQKDVKLAAIFTPEHGFRGEVEAGQYVSDGVEKQTGCPVYSLYGKIKKPTTEMLHGLDVLIYDIQDVGVRFYTFISTMALCMEAAAESDIPFWVLDRPNPLGGQMVEGPVLKKDYKSFVGMFPVPIRYGLTVGELALMVNGQGWLNGGVQADLTVIKMHNWRRDLFFTDTGLPWIKPSPNINSPHAMLLYPGIALLEATDISEGRGTSTPFEIFGAPWMEPKPLPENNQTAFIHVENVDFTPGSIQGMASNPKHNGHLCFGYRVTVTRPDSFRSVAFGVYLLKFLIDEYGDRVRLNKRWMDLLSGDSFLSSALNGDLSVEEILLSWKTDAENYLQIREKYLLY